jgi:phage terminase Nu1 subunit (DNA packaging protein)
MKYTGPSKLPAKQLAILFNVSEARISQLKRKGMLKCDADGKFDVAEARKMRNFQQTEHGVRMVMQTYGNGTGKVSAAKITLEGMDDALGLSEEEPEVAPSPNSHFVQQSKLIDLRTERMQYEADLRKIKLERERGSLIPRAEVQTNAADAAALIVNTLQSLPAQIAAIFATPEQKREVRAFIQDKIDAAQQSLYKAMKGEKDDDE